ncbi:MAG: FecR domain-containing protein [Pirellulales bacterium]
MVDSSLQANQPPEQPPDELLDLIWALSEGTVDGDGIARLNELLLSSAANRATYVRFLQVAAWLEYEQPAVPGMVPWPRSGFAGSLSSMVEGIATSLGRGASRGDVPTTARSTLADVRTTTASFRERIQKLSTARAIALTTCGVLLFVIAGLALRSSERPARGPDSDSQAAQAQGEVDVITVRLATAESRVLPIGDVGTVSIQGPAHLDLFGITHARLYQGRIKVRIDDERGHGFVVETPHGRVTDQGTEFGVDVAADSDTGVVVFEGIVDLAVLTATNREPSRVERLFQGQGLSLHQAGRTDRIMSIVTGNVSTFQRRGEARLGSAVPVITDVSDNIRSSGFNMFYEIVPAGLREDALAYADRPQHDWNGVDANGLPPYLIGADYVKPFNSDKMRDDVEITVSLAGPARLFVFFDDRVSPPEWLRESFRDTGDDIGLDCGPFVLDGVPIWFDHSKQGAGNSLDVTFSIWERIVEHAGTVRLGPNAGATYDTGMYAVSAVPLIEKIQ